MRLHLLVSFLLVSVQAAPTSESKEITARIPDTSEASELIISESDGSSRKNVINPSYSNNKYKAGYRYELPRGFSCKNLCVYEANVFLVCHSDFCVLGEITWHYEDGQYSPDRFICEVGKAEPDCVSYPETHQKRDALQPSLDNLIPDDLPRTDVETFNDQIENSYKVADAVEQIGPQTNVYYKGRVYNPPTDFVCNTLCYYGGYNTLFVCHPYYCVVGDAKWNRQKKRYSVCEAERDSPACLFLPQAPEDVDGDPKIMANGMSNVITAQNPYYLAGYVYAAPDGYTCQNLCLLQIYGHYFVCQPEQCLLGKHLYDYINKKYLPYICEAGKEMENCLHI